MMSVIRTALLYFYIRAEHYVRLDAFMIDIKDNVYATLRQISRVSPRAINLLMSIMNSPVILDAYSQLGTSTNIQDLFSRIRDNSFFVFYPNDLYGMTLVGNFVAVTANFRAGDDLSVSCTLLTLLHEAAHLSSRLNDPLAYFEITPIKLTKFKGQTQMEEENGWHFETLLFGEAPERIYIDGAKFLVDLESWNLPLKDFQSEFKSRQSIGEETGQRSMAVAKGGESRGYMVRGDCGLSMHSLRRNLMSSFDSCDN